MASAPDARHASSLARANAAGASTLGAFGTHGKITDAGTNLIILGARAYNPAEARFTTPDPIAGGCANPYTYAFGDPVNTNDLTGQAGCPVPSGGGGGSGGGSGGGGSGVSVSCQIGILSASCTLTIDPGEAAHLVGVLGSTGGVVGAAAVAAGVCGAIGFVATPVVAYLAGLGCSAIEAYGQKELTDWLQQASDANENANISVGIGFSGDFIDFYDSPISSQRCGG